MSAVSLRRATVMLALLAALIPSTVRSEPWRPPQPLGPRLKQLQRWLLMEPARERLDARNELLPREPAPCPPRRAVRPRAAKPAAHRAPAGKPGARLGVVKEPLSAASPAGPAARPARVDAFAPNVRVNNPALDTPVPSGCLKVGQSEQELAALGDDILIAYNDGVGCINCTVGCTGHTQGYSYSTDGGKTFKDGGAPPAQPGWQWLSDPVVMVDEKTGTFRYCGLVYPSAFSTSCIAVVGARFVGDTLIWDPPVLVRAPNDNIALDKPWMAVDSLSGRVYVIYTTFSTSADTIDFQSSADGLAWSDPVTLSANSDAGEVQGARVQVGPSGEVYTTWFAIGTSEPFASYFRFRHSVDGGVSFSAPTDAASLYVNFGSGAPGFNRERGITFPALAVDRSPGANRNRIHVAWNEGLDIFHDPIVIRSKVVEAEPNNTVAQANTFAVGDSVSGELTVGDIDFYKFAATQGQTVTFFTGTIDPNLDASMRILCSDGTTLLAYSQPGKGQPNLIEFTIPATGTYYLRMRQFQNSGQYTIYTFYHQHQAGDRARDHRDAFATFSDDSGRTWHPPVAINHEDPWYDDWLPELAVSGQGKPYAIWYDWRDAPASTCGGQSQVYLGRSDDGGLTWTTLGAVTDASSRWTTSQSNIAPNQGDYLGLFANATGVYPAWGDARDSSVDVYTVRLPLAATATQLALASLSAEPHRVSLSWYWAGSAGQIATVYRREPETAWVALGNAVADGTDLASYVDETVSPGTRYAYRLGVHDEAGITYSSETWVDVPERPSLAIQSVRPNPASRDVWVSYSLPAAGPATLELLDVAGRRVMRRVVEPRAGAFTVNLGNDARLRPGLYLVRLSQAGRSETARVTIVQ